jgi:hypothetical protein
MYIQSRNAPASTVRRRGRRGPDGDTRRVCLMGIEPKDVEK